MDANDCQRSEIDDRKSDPDGRRRDTLVRWARARTVAGSTASVAPNTTTRLAMNVRPFRTTRQRRLGAVRTIRDLPAIRSAVAYSVPSRTPAEPPGRGQGTEETDRPPSVPWSAYRFARIIRPHLSDREVSIQRVAGFGTEVLPPTRDTGSGMAASLPLHAPRSGPARPLVGRRGPSARSNPFNRLALFGSRREPSARGARCAWADRGARGACETTSGAAVDVSAG